MSMGPHEDDIVADLVKLQATTAFKKLAVILAIPIPPGYEAKAVEMLAAEFAGNNTTAMIRMMWQRADQECAELRAENMRCHELILDIVTFISVAKVSPPALKTFLARYWALNDAAMDRVTKCRDDAMAALEAKRATKQ